MFQFSAIGGHIATLLFPVRKTQEQSGGISRYKSPTLRGSNFAKRDYFPEITCQMADRAHYVDPKDRSNVDIV